MATKGSRRPDQRKRPPPPDPASSCSRAMRSPPDARDCPALAEDLMEVRLRRWQIGIDGSRWKTSCGWYLTDAFSRRGSSRGKRWPARRFILDRGTRTVRTRGGVFLSSPHRPVHAPAGGRPDRSAATRGAGTLRALHRRGRLSTPQRARRSSKLRRPALVPGIDANPVEIDGRASTLSAADT
jgi:hypothetical protein